MLRSVKDLWTYRLHATDGDIGKVSEFYFDDHSWTIRYLVADTGNWLVHRRVLIPPHVLDAPRWSDELFPVRLTREQIEASPPISADRPVSRQHEVALHSHFGWIPYWTEDTTAGRRYAEAHGRPVASNHAGAVQAEERAESAATSQGRDPYLRSTNAVQESHIEALDGSIGHVDDFIVDDETWILRYLVIDTRKWLPGKKVLLATEWVQSIDWEAREVRVDLMKGDIKDSPPYDPSSPVDRTLEAHLYDYYDRPTYWAARD